MTTTNGSGPAATPSETPANLVQSVDAIANQVHQLQATYTAMRRQVNLFSLAIVVVILVFSLGLVMSVKENLSADKIKLAAAAKAEQLMPKAQEQLLIGLKEAAPTYQKLAMNRFQAVLPTLSTKVEKLSQTAPKEVGNDLQVATDASLKRVSKRLEADLQTEFPKLTHEKLTQLGEQLSAQLAVTGGKLAEHLNELLTQELQRTQSALDGFPIDQYAGVSRDKLSRQLVHHMLMLVDYEVQTAGTKDGIDQTAAVPVH